MSQPGRSAAALSSRHSACRRGTRADWGEPLSLAVWKAGKRAAWPSRPAGGWWTRMLSTNYLSRLMQHALVPPRSPFSCCQALKFCRAGPRAPFDTLSKAQSDMFSQIEHHVAPRRAVHRTCLANETLKPCSTLRLSNSARDGRVHPLSTWGRWRGLFPSHESCFCTHIKVDPLPSST